MIPAITSTFENPMSIASTMAIIELNTDKNPLIPHAHGINLGTLALSILIPKGNGMPITKAIGARNTRVIMTRTPKEWLNNGTSRNFMAKALMQERTTKMMSNMCIIDLVGVIRDEHRAPRPEYASIPARITDMA